MPRLTVNERAVEVPPELADAPLLWVLREHLGLVGTKFGCGTGACGACTVIIDGEAVRSCVVNCGQAAGSSIATIEGLARNGELHPVQTAWIAEHTAQCGYCQAGQIMTTVALLARIPDPSDQQIEDALAANLCRCGTYERIRKAVKRAARLARGEAT